MTLRALFAISLFVIACARTESAPVNTAERKDRIVEHIKEKYKELAPVDLQLSDFSRVGGMDQAFMTMRSGEGPRQMILVSPDDRMVYLVMGEPFDASGSVADIQAGRAKTQQQRAEEVSKLVVGQPIRGNPNAPVTVIEFSDFQCPYCKRGFDNVEQLLQKYPNEVKFVFMHYPLNFHPWAKPAAVAAECAARQNDKGFWTLHDTYFRDQQSFQPDNVMEKSEQALRQVSGFDLKKWASCAKENTPENQSAQAEVDAQMQAAIKLGVEGTPAFFINGQFINGAVPVEELDKAVQKALKERG